MYLHHFPVNLWAGEVLYIAHTTLREVVNLPNQATPHPTNHIIPVNARDEATLRYEGTHVTNVDQLGVHYNLPIETRKLLHLRLMTKYAWLPA